jgi:hypothetical protein
MDPQLPPSAALGPGDVADLALVAFTAILASVVVSSAFAYLRDRGRLRLAARLLDAGQPVPAALFDHRPDSDLVRGVVLLATAVGVALYFLTGTRPELARAAIVPAAIGLGYLVGRRLERRRPATAAPPEA